jgi:AcrR family transcriptional regulator
VQRDRLFEAAAAVFARAGYAEASAEAIAREAGMSKATFYEHFANKEECILALFDSAAALTLVAMADATTAAGDDPRERMQAGAKAFLEMLASHPNESQTLLVEIIGAGEQGAERRDNIFAAFAQAIDLENAAAARKGTMSRFGSPHDAYAIVGAVAELASRQLRKGDPADVRELEPLVERLIFGLAPVKD